MPQTPKLRLFPVAAVAVALLVIAPAGASSYTIVPGGPAVTARTTAANENATLTFNGVAGRRISLKMTGVTIGTSGCCSTKVSILKPGGAALVAPVSVGRRGGFIDTKTLPVTGAYKILVDPQGTARGSMTLTLYDVPPDASAAIAPNAVPVTVSTATPGQNARLPFTGAAGQRVSANVSAVRIGTSSCCGARVSILKPDGTVLAPPTAVGTVGRFIEPQTLPAAGTYTLLLDPLAASTGSATLTLYNVPPDATAALTRGVAASLATSAPGQNFAPTFSGTAGQRVSFALTDVSVGTSSCCNLKVSIVKPDGTALFAPVTMGTSGGFVEPKTLPVTGTYKVRIDPQATDTGSLTLTVYDVPADVAASIAANGSPLTVTTTAPGQNARATFSGAAGQRVSLVMSNVTIGSSSCCSARVSILKPDKTALVRAMSVGTNGGFVDATALPVAGTYTILVDPQGTATGRIDLALYAVPADASGALATNGSPLTLTTATPGQNARATFTAQAGQRVSLKLSGVTLGSSSCCGSRVSILKPDRTALFSPALLVGTNGSFVEGKAIPATGTYTVVVDPLDASTGSITLNLWAIPPDVTAPIAPGGAPVTVTTTAPGQNARLTFAGTAGKRVSLNLANVTMAASEFAGAAITVRKPDGTTLRAATPFGTKGAFLEPIVLPVTGTYTILVDPKDASTGSATLTLYDVPPDVQASISVGGSQSLTLGTPGQNGRLTFAGTAGQRVTVTVSNVTIGASDECCSVDVSVVRPDGLTVASRFLGPGGGTVTAILNTSGTHTILVDPVAARTGSITVSLS